MDPTRFLGQKSEAVLAYLGGPTVSTEGRRLRLATAPAGAGWYRFAIEGRKATAIEPASPPDLSALAKLRGHLEGEWLFTSGSSATRVFLLPEVEPEACGLAVARRWHDGEAVFDTLDFDTEAEMSARLLLEEGRGLAGVAGVSPSLRLAYGWALVRRAARRLSVPVALAEVESAALRAADAGAAEAEAIVRAVDTERRERARTAEVGRAVREMARREAERAATAESGEARAERALEAAGASLLGTRLAGSGSLEVTFRFRGERFVSVVDPVTLHVFDAGICLSGHDEELTLESLPAVIRQAIGESRLVITRR